MPEKHRNIPLQVYSSKRTEPKLFQSAQSENKTLPKPDPVESSAPKIASRRIVLPAKLSEPERAALSRRLYEVHQEIFAGVSPEEFRHYVVDSPGETTTIQLFLAANDHIVGYCAVHRFRRRARGRSVIVLRAEAGLLPEYRGRAATYGFGIIRSALEKIRHPFTPVYYLGNLVHPSSYHLFYKYFSQMFPNPSREMPEALRHVALELVDSFRSPAVNEADPFVRNVGWATIESPHEQALNHRKDRPDVAFFKARNPGYPKGHGLLVIIPLTVGNLAAALLARLSERLLLAMRRGQPEL